MRVESGQQTREHIGEKVKEGGGKSRMEADDKNREIEIENDREGRKKGGERESP